ncbi:Autophagy protein 22 [Lobosporangium transversale]|uniref:Autophagy-related protein n=1 Tax=Lobosporangium transversale TaxID=64571 RepID=A0A1Y2H518_9FUNG|nr:autophagy-related protein 22-like protein [Lobosporangium transversale]KAF9907879.1 Autophagy protein 22 [Lobosporangium transversale]ORZ29104.1 autophagy-related protein 22-like protein [Lobosporangium transversale]|eukprot:XP_021886777.1 autophagy-related protein 22-like protein [Lobosporangium transversale]
MAVDTSKSPPLSKLQGLRNRLFYNDPANEIDLQPHIQEKLVKKSELWGFFLFGFGYYSWANVCASLLLPILIQGVARAASRLESDPSILCPDSDSDIPVGDRCLVPFGWIRVTPTSYVLMLNVVMVICTIFVTLGVSALADHGSISKKILVSFCTTLSAMACLFFISPMKPEIWWFCGLTFVIAGILNNVTLNFYDALIPNLTKYHPDVVRARLRSGEDSEEYIDAKVKVQTFLSGGASGAGYLGGLLLTIIIAIILLFTNSSLLTVGYCLVLAGVYIFFFVCLYTKFSVQRKFPPLPPGSNVLTFGYKRVVKTVRKARKLKTLFSFLCIWLILGDGLFATSNMVVLIAQGQLQLDSSSLIIAALIQFISAGLGIVFWIWIQNSRGLSPLKTVIINSCLFGLIPVYCLLGLIEGCPIGLKQGWELYMLAVFFGVFQGAIYSSNRVVYAQFIPLGHENELFALYEMSSVSSSWIAPLVCTAIIERSSVRHTWWFLGSQFFIPAFMLLFINVEKGRSEATAFYNAEKQKMTHQFENYSQEPEQEDNISKNV